MNQFKNQIQNSSGGTEIGVRFSSGKDTFLLSVSSRLISIQWVLGDDIIKDKSAGAWSWQFTHPDLIPRLISVDLNLYSLVRIHAVVIN
jgi:hypothetical protein